MSGSFEKLDVPPTLVSLCRCHRRGNRQCHQPEFKQPGQHGGAAAPGIRPKTGCPMLDSLKADCRRRWRS